MTDSTYQKLLLIRTPWKRALICIVINILFAISVIAEEIRRKSGE